MLYIEQVGNKKQCLGIDVLDQAKHVMSRFVAPVTMLATGGAGQVLPPLSFTGTSPVCQTWGWYESHVRVCKLTPST